ncbi:MAG TPA: UvrD-helicase domain-containing protein [Kiritimatiellia bacterium]|nr:UvrD-helicase domain-containing protein [Kiritimatiellia bacterium]
MTVRIEHRLFMASAGSGKTFQLAHRFIRLLALGADPGRILALTFARKAAGEMFDKILGRLADAASDPGIAAETAALIELPELGPDDFARLLGDLVRAMPRLQIATLDSFIIGIVRSFSLELGIEPDFSLSDESGFDGLRLRTETLRGLLGSSAMTRLEREAFLEAFKLATWGHEERGAARYLDRYIASHHALLLQLPHAHQWGEPATIWEGHPPWYFALEDTGPAVEVIRTWITEVSGTDKRLMTWWTGLVDWMVNYDPSSGQTVSDASGKFQRILAAVECPDEPSVIRSYGKDCLLTREVCEAWRQVLGSMVRREVESSLRRTTGLYRLLALYEERYDRLIRRRGNLTFQDAVHLLAGCSLATGESGGGENRLWIDYRLDRRIDHWLLDEFQDISTLQWQVLENLIDEVLQDPEGDRSFFCVGDIKQSIYRWRGANPRLMLHLRDHYRRALIAETLSISYRSSPAVLDTVNQVFGNLPVAAAMGADQEKAFMEWSALWTNHRPRPNVSRSGYTALLEYESPEGEQGTHEERFAVVASLLNQIRPLERGLSVGILVRANTTGNALAPYLRIACPGMAVALEGSFSLADSMAVLVLLSLVRAIAHPGDTEAWGHLAMSPLHSDLPATGAERGTFVREGLQTLQRHGFSGLLRPWAIRLTETMAPCAFSRGRIDELLAAADTFDARGESDPDAFLAFMEGYSLREQRARAIRIMTVHQAKGLEFDMVILADLQSRGGGGEVFLTGNAHDPQAAPAWTMKRPRNGMVDADPVLARENLHLEAEEEFESLCVLYVAMTRAAEALYLVTSYPGKDSKVLSHAGLIKKCFGHDVNSTTGESTVMPPGLPVRLMHESDSGQRGWYEAHPLRAREASEPLPVIQMVRAVAPVEFDRKSPSTEAEAPREARQVFSTTARDSRAIGRGVHEVFERIEWLEEGAMERALAEWKAARLPDDSVAEAVGRHLACALATVAAQNCLRKPEAPHAETWREDGFDVLLDRTWITGTFDRVVLTRDEKGGFLSGEIVDFKTNQITAEHDETYWRDHYAPQLNLYRRVLATLTGLDPRKITTRLLFTQTGSVVDC